MPGYLGKADCHLCGNEVDVSENRAGRAYYRCARCGMWVQLVNPRGDRMLKLQVRGTEDPDEDKPAPAENPPAPAAREPSAVPTPTQAPVSSQKPVNQTAPQPTPRPPRATGFFFSGAK